MSGAAPTVVVVGAGMGGLAAAVRLAQRGASVQLLEARAEPGGLASAVSAGGLDFDGGPYILLDRPGLEWAFAELGLDVGERARLRPVEDVCEVASGTHRVRFHADLARTADGLEQVWPGSARAYRAFVSRGEAAHRALQQAQRVSRPGLRQLARDGAWRHAGLMFQSLGAVLRRSRLPAPVAEAIGIWTRVAGQSLDRAPGFMALLPALLHTAGPCRPDEGIAVLPRLLAEQGAAAGVQFRYGTPVRRIRCEDGRATGVETDDGFVRADAVVSDAGIATYLELARPVPDRARGWLESLPLQSPGVAAYLAVERSPPGSYLRFRLTGGRAPCRLLVTPVPSPGAASPPLAARLLVSMDHADARRGGRAAQEAYLDGVLGETWWREGLGDVRVVGRRLPADWGREFRLHADAMNPVMTARFARQGRLAHRSPWIRDLYLAGSATHPGQWLSFAAISGILAADCLIQDRA